MAHVLIYTKTTCPYCVQAKDLLSKRGVVYEEVDLNRESDRRDEMISKSNGKTTVPQIFINNMHIGGYSDLEALQRQGSLDKLLGTKP